MSPSMMGAPAPKPPRVTLFASPKPFRGHSAIIQKNAYRSWAKLGCEVLVLDDSEGTAEICRELGFRHLPHVEKSPHGPPLLSSLWSEARRHATNDVICYVNSDIILFSDFLDACRCLERGPALLISRRTDLDVTELIDFDDPSWARRLREDARRRGKLHTKGGVDYFAHKKEVLGELPPMVLGRGYYDMWLIYRAQSLGARVIDATDAVLCVHQNHDYAHVVGGADYANHSPDAFRNKELANWPDHVWDPRDASHELTEAGLLVKRAIPLRRRLKRLATLHPHVGWPVRLAWDAVRAVKRAAT